MVESKEVNYKKILYIILGFVGFLIIVLIIASSSNFGGAVDKQFGNNTFLVDLIRDHRWIMLKNDIIRTLIFIILFGVAIIFFQMKKLSLIIFSVVVTLFVSIDLVNIGWRYINDENYTRDAKNQFAPIGEADKAILNDKSTHRVLNLANTFQEAKTSSLHHSIGGYHGAKIKRYKQLIEGPLIQDINGLINKLQSGSNDMAGLNTVNMLNAKYIKASEQRQGLIVNNNAYGNAWFAKNVIEVNSAQEEYDQLMTITSKEDVLVDKSKFKVSQSSFTNNGIY